MSRKVSFFRSIFKKILVNLMNKRIITTTGYGGSGSSAATGFLSEFNSVKAMTGKNNDFETFFLQAVWGIIDLEHHIVKSLID